jgi:hypothetical protein
MDYEMDFDKAFDVNAIDVDAMIGADVDFDDDTLTLPDDALFDDEDDY